MKQRLDFLSATPNVVRAMLGLHKPLSQSGLEKGLLDLVYFRVSQINGCAYCLDMHSKDLRAAGESEQRLYLLDAWRESPFYTCLLYTSPSPRDRQKSRMPSSA